MTDKIKPNAACGPETANSSSLSMDWDLFGEHLKEFDMTDAQERELLEALWSLVVGFVDLGLGIHPAQLVAGICCERIDGSATGKASSVVDCSNTINTKFSASAGRKSEPTQPERSPE